MTKLLHDNIPSLGDRYRLTLENTTEMTVINLKGGGHEIYIKEQKVATLTSKDSKILITILAGVLPVLFEEDDA